MKWLISSSGSVMSCLGHMISIFSPFAQSWHIFKATFLRESQSVPTKIGIGFLLIVIQSDFKDQNIGCKCMDNSIHVSRNYRLSVSSVSKSPNCNWQHYVHKGQLFSISVILSANSWVICVIFLYRHDIVIYRWWAKNPTMGRRGWDLWHNGNTCKNVLLFWYIVV